MAYSGDTSAAIQGWLGRLDDDCSLARDELVRISVDRVRSFVRHLFKRFTRLRRWEDSDDVLQSALMRLHSSLAKLRPKTPQEFYGLATLHIRRVLIDLARHHYGPEGHAGKHLSPPDGEVGSSWLAGKDGSAESLSLDDWSEFHERVVALPPELRETFELIFYHGMTRQAVADLLGVSERTVRRRWYEARRQLGLEVGDTDANDRDPPEKDNNP